MAFKQILTVLGRKPANDWAGDEQMPPESVPENSDFIRGAHAPSRAAVGAPADRIGTARKRCEGFVSFNPFVLRGEARALPIFQTRSEALICFCALGGRAGRVQKLFFARIRRPIHHFFDKMRKALHFRLMNSDPPCCVPWRC